MKSLKPPLGKLKTVAVLVSLAGFVLIAGFTATKTLIFPGKSRESPGRPDVNASHVGGSVVMNANSAGRSYGEPIVSADKHDATPGSNTNVMVWVNTNSSVYHCPNTRWYGNTKNGKYMTQQEARSIGYWPARGSMCR